MIRLGYDWLVEVIIIIKIILIIKFYSFKDESNK
jgi:hypothetical protein